MDVRFDAANNNIELLSSQLALPISASNIYLRDLIEERSEKK